MMNKQKHNTYGISSILVSKSTWKLFTKLTKLLRNLKKGAGLKVENAARLPFGDGCTTVISMIGLAL